jgi:F-type H+-transporting ATPase subunit delta
MKNPRLAGRYAKSLLDLSIEQNSLDSTLADMQVLDATCKASREFEVVLRSPVIKADKKEAVINAVMGNKLQPLTKGFMTLLVKKGREPILPEIASAFIAQYKEMKGIRMVKLTTAIPADDNVRAAIRSKVAAYFPGQSVELKEEVNPALIGGFVLEMGDRLVDASVRRDLAEVKKQFLQNLYVQNIR